MAYSDFLKPRTTTIKINGTPLSTIVDGSMVFDDYLFSGSMFEYGGCCGSTFEFQTTNTAIVVGDAVTVYYAVGSRQATLLFNGYVTETSVDKTTRVIKVNCIDKYSVTIANEDASSWFNSLSFPITLGAFTDAYITRLGFGGTRSISNNGIQLKRPNLISGYTFRDIGRMIGQLGCAFGRYNGTTFDFKSYGGMGKVVSVNTSENVASSSKISDEPIKAMTKVHIGQSVNDAGGSYGTDTGETYEVLGNILCEGLSTATLNTIAETIHGRLNAISRPYPAIVDLNISMDVNPGDKLSIYGIADSAIPVLCNNVRMSGSQLTKMSIFFDVSTTRQDQKSLSSESKLQNYNYNGNTIVNKINGTTQKIQATNIQLEGYTTINGAFKVDLAGNMEATNASIAGTVTSTTLNAEDGMKIGSGSGTQHSWKTALWCKTTPDVLNVAQGFLGLYFKAGQSVKTDVAIETVSDRGMKNSINMLDYDASEAFIMALKPCSYKYNNGVSGRLHHGFIAQDVKDAMGDNDWGVYTDADPSEPGNKSLRYEELIADMVATLQKQNERIAELERRLSGGTII